MAKTGWLTGVGLSGLLLTGCATTSLYGTSASRPVFFGMAVRRIEDANQAFSNVRLKLDNTIEYSQSPRLVKEGITARAWFDYSLQLAITNQGNMPISLNYFSDQYYMKTDAGRTYELQKGDILYYPSSTINPGTSMTLSLRMPQQQAGEKAVLIAAQVDYGKTIIVLKPIEVVEVKQEVGKEGTLALQPAVPKPITLKNGETVSVMTVTDPDQAEFEILLGRLPKEREKQVRVKLPVHSDDTLLFWWAIPTGKVSKSYKPGFQFSQVNSITYVPDLAQVRQFGIWPDSETALAAQPDGMRGYLTIPKGTLDETLPVIAYHRSGVSAQTPGVLFHLIPDSQRP